VDQRAPPPPGISKGGFLEGRFLSENSLNRNEFPTNFSTVVFGPALGPTPPPAQRVPESLSLGIKRPGREADHSPPSSAEVNAWSYTSTPPIRLHDVVLS
jgi:hypothetical protein